VDLRNFFPALLLILLFSCNKERVLVSKDARIKDQVGWLFRDSLQVPFAIADTQPFYALRLVIHHDPDFRYENLYTRITTHFPNRPAVVQILSLQLANDRGKWEGRCNASRCRVTVSLQEKILFPIPGEYRISIAQYSRADTLAGLQSLRLELVNQGERPRQR